MKDPCRQRKVDVFVIKKKENMHARKKKKQINKKGQLRKKKSE